MEPTVTAAIFSVMATVISVIGAGLIGFILYNMKEMRADMKEMRADMKEMRAEIKSDIKDLRDELNTRIDKLEAKVDDLAKEFRAEINSLKASVAEIVAANTEHGVKLQQLTALAEQVSALEHKVLNAAS